MIVKETGLKTFAPAPEGVHGAVCIDIVDKGLLTSEYQGQKRERVVVVLRWAIDETRDDGKQFFVEKWYTASLNEKATLRADLEQWRGKKFTPEELAGFDLENVLHKPCQLVVMHSHKQDRTYANVKGIAPLAKGMKAMKAPDDYVREMDRPPQNGHGPAGPTPFDPDDDMSDLPF